MATWKISQFYNYPSKREILVKRRDGTVRVTNSVMRLLMRLSIDMSATSTVERHISIVGSWIEKMSKRYLIL